MRAFITIFLVTGYNTLSTKRMYWEQESDVLNCAISDLVSRNQFHEVLRYLHQADNHNLQEKGKLIKVRPFYDMINKKFLQTFQMEEKLCVNESMIPCYSKHSAKQYIKGKSIKFGYKIWCLNTSQGYGL